MLKARARWIGMPVVLKSRLAKIGPITGKIALGLAAFLLFFVLACVIVNSFDTPLSEQAKTLLAQPANPHPSEENIYLAMAGLEGPGERPITALGQEESRPITKHPIQRC
jgi:hypothetical protein